MRRFFTFIFIANFLAIGVFWWLGSSDLLKSGGWAEIFIAVGRLTGLLGEFFILVELVLISRLSPLEHAYGFDILNRWHRKIGSYLAFCIIVHPVFLTIGYAGVNGVSIIAQFFDFLSHWEHVVLAFVGLATLVAATILSLSFARKRFKYEAWHVSHLFMYVAIVLLFLHQTKGGDVSAGVALYYWLVLNFTAFGILLAYRFARPLVLFRKHKFFVEKVMPETGDVFSVYISGRAMEAFTFESGQYVHVSFLTKGLWQPHPFSLSSAFNGKFVRVSVKALGDYTAKISTLVPGTKVIIEGPFGRFTEATARYEKFLFIAGGIGITPIRSLIESLARKGKDVILLYGNRTPEDVVFKQELESIPHSRHYIFSQAGQTQTSPLKEFELGYIDDEKIKRLAPDFQTRDIYLCGPPKMMDSVIKILNGFDVPEKQIHYEKFAY